MSPAHSRRRDLRRPCRRRDAATNVDLSDLAGIIRNVAVRVARELNDPAWDREDIEQEFRIRLIEGLSGYDPDLGDRMQFVKMLLKRQRVSLVRRRYAEKRAASAVSLQTPIDGDDGEATLGSLVSGDRRLAELGWAYHTAIDQADLLFDMQTVVEKLDANGRRVAEAVMDSESKVDAAQTAGLRRTTFNDHVNKLRSPFQQSGMQHFLE